MDVICANSELKHTCFGQWLVHLFLKLSNPKRSIETKFKLVKPVNLPLPNNPPAEMRPSLTSGSFRWILSKSAVGGIYRPHIPSLYMYISRLYLLPGTKNYIILHHPALGKGTPSSKVALKGDM